MKKARKANRKLKKTWKRNENRTYADKRCHRTNWARIQLIVALFVTLSIAFTVAFLFRRHAKQIPREIMKYRSGWPNAAQSTASGNRTHSHLATNLKQSMSPWATLALAKCLQHSIQCTQCDTSVGLGPYSKIDLFFLDLFSPFVRALPMRCDFTTVRLTFRPVFCLFCPRSCVWGFWFRLFVCLSIFSLFFRFVTVAIRFAVLSSRLQFFALYWAVRQRIWKAGSTHTHCIHCSMVVRSGVNRR